MSDSEYVYLQTTVAKIEKFSHEPLTNKLASDVPGIGPKIQVDLAKAKIVMAEDLYNQLEKLNFSEEKFRVWMRLHCSKRARVPVIYKALAEWHGQFGEPVRTVQKNVRMETPQSRPAASVCVRRKSQVTPAPPRRRISKLLQMIQEDNSLPSSNKLMQYLESFSTIFKNIPEEFHSEFRRDILNLAEKYEAKTKVQEKTNEPQPSTSH